MISNISFGKLPPNTKYISKNLIVGAKQGICGLLDLKQTEDVNCVIDLQWKFGLTICRPESILCKILRLKYCAVPMTLKPKAMPIREKFEQAFKVFEENKEGRTFVHCSMGWHRSLLFAALTEIRAGRIKNFEDFSEFLKARNFYNVSRRTILSAD